jgi:hypothetical protein
VEGFDTFWALCDGSASAKGGGAKGFNGVGTLVRRRPGAPPVTANPTALGSIELDSEGRCLVTDHGTLMIFNVYVPNSGSGSSRLPYKLRFLQALRERMIEVRRLLWLGLSCEWCVHSRSSFDTANRGVPVAVANVSPHSGTRSRENGSAGGRYELQSTRSRHISVNAYHQPGPSPHVEVRHPRERARDSPRCVAKGTVQGTAVKATPHRNISIRVSAYPCVGEAGERGQCYCVVCCVLRSCATVWLQVEASLAEQLTKSVTTTKATGEKVRTPCAFEACIGVRREQDHSWFVI